MRHVVRQGGNLKPLTEAGMQTIHMHVMDILANIGFSEAPSELIDLVVSNGGTLTDKNRLCFPTNLVEKALGGLNRDFALHGRDPQHQLTFNSQNVYTGTGGASPQVIDLHTSEYRKSTLSDLYDFARLVDTLPHVHFFSRTVVANDIPDPFLLDINTAYASLAGTNKHVMVSASNERSVEAIARMCFQIAGSKQAFIAQPFLSLNINHVVSPLRFSAEACEVLVAAAKFGIPTQVNTFSQMGASTPVTIAGCIAQTIAETIAGVVIAWLANSDVKAIFGPRPMVTDLRTGGMAGGCGEQALLTAAATQMSLFYQFPCSTIAGATDSKIPDAQSGFEKALAVGMAAQSGANLVTQSCGTHAGLMACSLESLVIDNEMLGSIHGSLASIDTSSDALNTDMIQSAVTEDGHYLGQPETFARMETDFIYPSIANRQDHEAWAIAGKPDIRTLARTRVESILNEHNTHYIEAGVAADIQNEFDIRLVNK